MSRLLSRKSNRPRLIRMCSRSVCSLVDVTDRSNSAADLIPIQVQSTFVCGFVHKRIALRTSGASSLFVHLRFYHDVRDEYVVRTVYGLQYRELLYCGAECEYR